MRRAFFLLLGVALLWAGALAQQPPAEPTPADKMREAWARMSKIQALLEYFYMEQGQYPQSLTELDTAFKSLKPKDGLDVVIPNDPATNKPFVYICRAPYKKYALSIPDAAAYGGQSFTLPEVDWGFMANIAEQRRREQLALQCAYNLKNLATKVELYAKDHGKEFPKSMDDLFPNYINRYPQCPASGKNYSFAPTAAGYDLICPNPGAHGLKTFKYDSKRGMTVEETGASAKPTAAPSPDPSPSETP